jgi:GT2 family glycosyltransferase
MNKLLILIVTYNGSNYIEDCLNSIYSPGFLQSVLIIDNFSSDDTVNLVQLKFPKVVLIKNSKNLGFGKANNIGFKYAIENGFDSIFLLNQDAILFPDTIINLLKISKKVDNIGFLSPIHLDKTSMSFESNFEYFLNLSFRRKLISKIFFKNNELNYTEVDFVNAAAWLIPIQTVIRVGGFNPIFPHYSEDIDYYNRLKYFGYKNYLVFDSFIKHFSSNGEVKKSSKVLITREVFERVAILCDINYSFLFLLRNLIVRFIANFFIFLIPFNFYKIKFEIIVFFKLTFLTKQIVKVRKFSKNGNSFL